MDRISIDNETPIPIGTKLTGTLFIGGENKGLGGIECKEEATEFLKPKSLAKYADLSTMDGDSCAIKLRGF